MKLIVMHHAIAPPFGVVGLQPMQGMAQQLVGCLQTPALKVAPLYRHHI
jgi:hypothetical protein